MRNWTLCLLVGTLVAFLTPAANANPTLPTDIPELEAAIRAVIERGSYGDCETLSEYLSRTGFRILREDTLPLVHRNMHVLEPCIVASQRLADKPDPALHREFRAHASESSIASMCEVLRERLTLSHAMQALLEDPMKSCEDPVAYVAKNRRQKLLGDIVRLLGIAEILADYQDPLAGPTLASLLSVVDRRPVERFWSRHYSEYVEPPSWFVRMALRRLAEPGAVAVFEPLEDGRCTLLRSEEEVAELEFYSYPALGLQWHTVHLPQGVVPRFFALLESSPRANPVWIREERTAALRLRFEDGVTATVTAYSQGWVSYDDNTRFTDDRRCFTNQALANDILALIERAKIAPAATAK